MQALIEKLSENKTLMFIAAAVALLAAAALILLIFRLAFGRRLRMSGNGRARLPRLGIVDAFDLDRQRQLVIVRRDNVEHLIMIGGPNDLVIESEIIRAESREVRSRDKEPREAPPGPAGVAWPPEIEAPVSAPSGSQPAPQRKAPFPSAAPAPDLDRAPVAAFDALAAPSAPTIVAPAPRPPVFPLPPRRTPPLTSPLPPRAPAQREPPIGRSDPAQRIETGANPLSGFPRAPLATPFLRPSPPRQLAEGLAAGKPTPSTPEAPSAEPSPSAPATDAAAPSPISSEPNQFEPKVSAEPQREASAPPDFVAAASSIGSAPPLDANAQAPIREPIDSLEEEMAKLLGRGPG